MSEDKKTERRKEIIGVCLDCFVEKGLTATTTKDPLRGGEAAKRRHLLQLFHQGGNRTRLR